MNVITDPRMTKARSVLIQDHPFYGTLAMRLTLVADPKCPRMATDGEKLFYNPAFLDTLTDPHLRFIYAHEVSHCTLGHHARRGNRDPLRWNKATDYVINRMLTDAGFDRPDWVLFDHRFDGFNSDQVYRILEEEEKKQKQDQPEPQSGAGQQQPQPSGSDQSDDGQPEDSESGKDDGDADDQDQDGSGPAEDGSDDAEPSESGGNESSDDSGEQSEGGDAGDGSDPSTGGSAGGTGAGGVGEQPATTDGPVYHGDYPGSCGEVLDAAPQHEEAALNESAEEWATFTRQAVNIARRIGEGKVPGYLEEVINDLERGRTDWRDALRRFVDPSSTKDYSWTKPNLRYAASGFITPGLVTDGVSHVAMLIDTSGSVSQDWLNKFGSEVQTALDNGAIDKITLVFCDTRVNRTAEYNHGDVIDFTVAGRGGTEFAPAIQWVKENAPDVVAAIYFTDMGCSDFGEEPPFPMMWAAYGDPRVLSYYIPRVPFGEVIELADY